MSIQSNFNNNLTSIAVVASLASINNSIKQLGFNDYQELMSAINTLKIEIADSEDKGLSCEKKKELLTEYLDIKAKYDAEVEKQKETQRTVAIIFGVLAVIFVVAMLAIATSM